MVDQVLMNVCAMRLDETVQAVEFVRAVLDIEHEARLEMYRHLRGYQIKFGTDALLKRIESIVEGRGWEPIAPIIPPGDAVALLREVYEDSSLSDELNWRTRARAVFESA